MIDGREKKNVRAFAFKLQNLPVFEKRSKHKVSRY